MGVCREEQSSILLNPGPCHILAASDTCFYINVSKEENSALVRQQQDPAPPRRPASTAYRGLTRLPVHSILASMGENPAHCAPSANHHVVWGLTSAMPFTPPWPVTTQCGAATALPILLPWSVTTKHRTGQCPAHHTSANHPLAWTLPVPLPLHLLSQSFPSMVFTSVPPITRPQPIPT